ncbi:hypothetical protein INT44_003243 [Umbelopsis vinacea]|uniref:Uncharacterized protein n=1 Tax=Umbelopsis vinacea TaxID=44442 RepID=A0A8H7Q7L7_9FUNG|nr:hypothetical protein INT44_003243 [Umbelopsis vinacea]
MSNEESLLVQIVQQLVLVLAKLDTDPWRSLCMAPALRRSHFSPLIKTLVMIASNLPVPTLDSTKHSNPDQAVGYPLAWMNRFSKQQLDSSSDMQGFTFYLAIAAVTLCCGPRFSTAAPSRYSIRYITTSGENKVFPVVLDECQRFPVAAAVVINTTPFTALFFRISIIQKTYLWPTQEKIFQHHHNSRLC